MLAAPTLLAVLIEANQSATRYGKSDLDVHQTLLDRGFALCDYDPFTRRLTPAGAAGPGTEGNGCTSATRPRPKSG